MGFTVFPCVETDDMDAKEAKRRRKLCSRAGRHTQLAHDALMRIRDRGLSLAPEKQFEFLRDNPALGALAGEDAYGQRPVDWRWTPEHDAIATDESSGFVRIDALHALAEAMCRGKA